MKKNVLLTARLSYIYKGKSFVYPFPIIPHLLCIAQNVCGIHSALLIPFVVFSLSLYSFVSQFHEIYHRRLLNGNKLLQTYCYPILNVSIYSMHFVKHTRAY